MTVIPLFGLLAAAMYMVAARTYLADLKKLESVEPALETESKPQPA
jgi:hypothetical protein